VKPNIQETKADPKKVKENARKVIREWMTAVYLGYKVRRILRGNRAVGQLKKELCDLMRFAKILRTELNDA
jgi:hypothetical protein